MTFDKWWRDEGRFIDPDTSDVSWFDKREGLAHCAFDAAAGGLEAADAIDAEIERLENWVNDLHSGMWINCVYCGHRYGPNTETPSMRNALREHVETCPRHPMSKLKAVVDKLPKCWRLNEDGVLVQDVPVIIGETELWWLPPLFAEQGPVSIGVCFCVTCGMKLGPTYVIGERGSKHRLFDCYDTHEAAEVALKEREASG